MWLKVPLHCDRGLPHPKVESYRTTTSQQFQLTGECLVRSLDRANILELKYPHEAWRLDCKFFQEEKSGAGKTLLTMAQFSLPEMVIKDC
jgi:hypothetical protein